MKKLWPWLRDKAWPFVKKHWKVFAAALALLAVYLLGKGILNQITNVASGKVEKPDNFMRLPGDETHVLVRVGAGWQAVPVPGGEASKVTAVQVTPGGTAIVEKHNATIDQV